MIADCQADPFCLDLAQENSPIYFAYHDNEAWEFNEYCADFLAFIKGVQV